MGDFFFNGHWASDLGLVVEHIPRQHIPRKNMTTITIPGRSEPLHQWDGSYEPFTAAYACWFPSRPVANRARQVKEWLLSAAAGTRLEDTYNEEVFYHATYAGGADIENALNRFGRVTIEFECAAPAYLKSGEMPIQVDVSANVQEPTPVTIRNDTPFPAYPLLHIHRTTGNGCVAVVAGHEIDVMWGSSVAKDLYFDCAMQEAWIIVDGAEVSANELMSLNVHSFPCLAPGDNSVELRGGGADYMELIPRFWTL